MVDQFGNVIFSAVGDLDFAQRGLVKVSIKSTFGNLSKRHQNKSFTCCYFRNFRKVISATRDGQHLVAVTALN